MSIQKIFFSYSRNDASSFASQLAADLGKAGFDVWIDQQDIPAGLEWDLEIQKALDGCDCLLFIESNKSVVSKNVLDEVYYALSQNKKVIPVIYHDSKTPFRLQRLQHIDLSKDYYFGLALLLKELKAEQPFAGNTETEISPLHKPSSGLPDKYGKLLVAAALLILSIAAVFLYFSSEKDQRLANTRSATAPATVVELPPNESQAAPEETKEPTGTEIPADKKQLTVTADSVLQTKDAQKPLVSKAKDLSTAISAASLVESFVGDWQLVSVEPKPASHRGYLKMEALDEKRVKLLSSFQFYFKKTNAEAQFVVFNGIASCASCIPKKKMKITDYDIAFGTNRYTILKEDTDEGKSGDTTATMGGNSSISAQVTLQLISDNNIIIKVENQVATPISYGFVVAPFAYTFHFTKRM